MNSRLSAFVLPLVAIVVYVLIDFGYVFLVKDKYAEVVRNIQRGEEMKLDLIAAISCYLRKTEFSVNKFEYNHLKL